MGGSASELAFAAHPPTVILMAGLQGSGKTTTSGKLAAWLQKHDAGSAGTTAEAAATIEVVDMFEVPIAHVGVVIAFVGNEGKDVTGDQFRLAQA